MSKKFSFFFDIFSQVVHSIGSSSNPPKITGCWDFFRDQLFVKSHFVYWLDVFNLVVVLPARAETVFRGILISSGVNPLEVQVEDLSLFNDGSANNELLLKYLNARGLGEKSFVCVCFFCPNVCCLGDLLSKNSSGHIAAVNNLMSAEKLSWKQAMHPNVSLRILELETKLCPRKKLVIGVVYGRANESEEQMFLQSSSPKFEKFLSVLGDVCEVGGSSFMGSFLGGFNESDAGQNFVYTSFAGFEIVLQVAPFLDPARQRQHIGNCTTLIFYKEGGMENFSFRGAVNSLALVVKPIESADRKGSAQSTSSSSSSSLALPSTPSSLSSSTSPRTQRRPVKKKRKNRVKIESFHRATLSSFSVTLPERELDLDKDRAIIRSFLFANGKKEVHYLIFFFKKKKKKQLMLNMLLFDLVNLLQTVQNCLQTLLFQFWMMKERHIKR